MSRVNLAKVATPASPAAGTIDVFASSDLVPAGLATIDESGNIRALVPTTAEALATAETAISAATYADITGCSISLTPGTWLITGVVVGRLVNALGLMLCAITDNANTVIREASQGIPASGAASVNNLGSVTLIAIVTVAATTSYKLRAARALTTLTTTWTAVDGNGLNTANQASNNSDKGTGISAVRLY